MSYKAGQILYLLVNDEMKIIPAQVVEVVVRHKFNEDVSTSYNLLLPGKSGAVVSLDEIDASVFTDSASLHAHMLGNATTSIDKMIAQASNQAERFFSVDAARVHPSDDVVK